jgi:hypothetical protein
MAEEARVQSTAYTIIVRGILGERFASTFPDVAMLPADGRTRIETKPLDQSQLHGLLDQLRDLAIELVSVNERSLAGPGPQQR